MDNAQSMTSASTRLPHPATAPGPLSGRPRRSPGYACSPVSDVTGRNVTRAKHKRHGREMAASYGGHTDRRPARCRRMRGGSMFADRDQLLSYIKDEDVEMVDVRFCDLPGVMQHFTVPVSSFDEAVFEDGLMFDGSSIRGFQAIHESDMALFPDPTTAYIDTFRADKTLVVNFFIHDPLTGEAYSRDPRNIARKAQAYLKSTGIGDTAYFAPEAES